MSQEMRHKSNKEDILRGMDKLIASLEKVLKDAMATRAGILAALDGSITTLAGKAKAYQGTGLRRPVPASIHRHLERVVRIMREERQAIENIPVTRMEKDAALVRDRKEAKKGAT
ncbi:MAG: hypothetical protein Q8P59_10010 [Dehalococcoidia bacterium]|nr:hypothetical protein [Dehalococcoidia bacterium]